MINLAFLPRQFARTQPERVAIVEGAGRRVTYGEFESMSGALAARLRQAGLEPGHLCALAIREDALHMAAIFAVWRLGAILLPLDSRAAVAEVATIIERFRPRLLAGTENFVRSRGDIDVLAIDARDAGDLPVPPIQPLENDPALYGLSSGSSGEPKAAVITHRQHIARVMSYALSYPLRSDDRYLSTMPVAYNWGRNMAISHLCLGATLMLVPTFSSPADLIDAAHRLGATTMAAVPSVTLGLLGLPDQGAPLLPGLRAYFSSGAPLHASARKEARERLSANLTEAYGSTETGGIAVLAPQDQQRAPGSVGQPAIGVEIAIVDDAGVPVPAGQSGQVRCRGLGVIERYLNASPSDAQRLDGGWYYTGDVGHVDNAGFLYLEGRESNIIKRGGYTISAAEIERILVSHPAVADAAIAGVPAGNIGEDIVAFVVAKPELQLQELLNHCRLKLSAIKQPQAVQIVDAIPRNAAGKVSIAALRSLVAQDGKN